MVVFASGFLISINISDNSVNAVTFTLDEFKKVKTVKNVYKEYSSEDIDGCVCVTIATGKTKKHNGFLKGQYKRYNLYSIYDWDNDETSFVKTDIGYAWYAIKSKVPVYKKKKVYYKINKPYDYMIYSPDYNGKDRYLLSSNNYYVSQKPVYAPYQGKFVHKKYYKLKKVIKKYVIKKEKYKKNYFWGNSKYLEIY
ncbi:hypothetical protein SDC9_40607 [bioreactor metagenome]|uniref:Uncharacterized protein n=2 Tax=root TaxID=1 RepID=A0A644VVS3_9ZZZZ